MGMVVESILSYDLRHLSEDNLVRIKSLIESFGYDLSLESIKEDQFLAALKRDKKNRKGNVRFIFPTDIGQTKSISGVTNDAIFSAITDLFGDILK